MQIKIIILSYIMKILLNQLIFSYINSDHITLEFKILVKFYRNLIANFLKKRFCLKPDTKMIIVGFELLLRFFKLGSTI